MNLFILILLTGIVMYLGFHFKLVWVSILTLIILAVVLSSAPKPKAREKPAAAGPQTIIVQQAPELALTRGTKGTPIFIKTDETLSPIETIGKVVGVTLGVTLKIIYHGLRTIFGVKDKKF